MRYVTVAIVTCVVVNISPRGLRADSFSRFPQGVVYAFCVSYAGLFLGLLAPILDQPTYFTVFGTLLDRAVERSMKGSHQMGIFLSGGYDSRSVAASIRKHHLPHPGVHLWPPPVQRRAVARPTSSAPGDRNTIPWGTRGHICIAIVAPSSGGPRECCPLYRPKLDLIQSRRKLEAPALACGHEHCKYADRERHSTLRAFP